MTTERGELKVPEAASDSEYVIITAEWNSAVTHALRDGAHDTLLSAGVEAERIRHISVPGTVELTYAAARAIRSHSSLRPLGIIIIGCVIRGDTPHFDYVCQQVSQGTAILNSRGECPVIFGVLTVDNEQQALDRAGGRLGNKGAEAAVAAIEMAAIRV